VTGPSGLAPERVVLDSGLVVLAREARTTPAVTLHASLQAGARFDPPELGGAAHFVSHTIDRGTRSRPGAELAEALDERGVSLEVVAARRTITLACTCLVEDFDAVLAILAGIVREPAFPARDVETKRGEILTQIRQDADDPYEVAGEHVMAELYGAAHPYGRPVMGTAESVTRIDPAALAAFHAQWFAPARIALAVVGDVATARAVDAVAAAFDGWAPAPAALPDLPPPAGIPGRRVVRVPMPGKAQAEIAYGFTGLARNDPGYDAAWLTMNILGQYSLGGRLGDRIREREGMAYHVFGAMEPDLIAAPLVIEAGVDPANVEKTIAAIDEEVERFRADGPTRRELDESRQFLVGALPRMLESNPGIAAFLQMAEAFGLGLDYDVRLRDRLSGVTVEQVRETARTLIDPARAVSVVAGG